MGTTRTFRWFWDTEVCEPLSSHEEQYGGTPSSLERRCISHTWGKCTVSLNINVDDFRLQVGLFVDLINVEGSTDLKVSKVNIPCQTQWSCRWKKMPSGHMYLLCSSPSCWIKRGRPWQKAGRMLYLEHNLPGAILSPSRHPPDLSVPSKNVITSFNSCFCLIHFFCSFLSAAHHSYLRQKLKAISLKHLERNHLYPQKVASATPCVGQSGVNSAEQSRHFSSLWLQLSKHFWQISCGNVFLNVILQKLNNKELNSKLEKANQRKWTVIGFWGGKWNRINIWISIIPFVISALCTIIIYSFRFWKGFKICWLSSTSFGSHKALQRCWTMSNAEMIVHYCK